MHMNIYEYRISLKKMLIQIQPPKIADLYPSHKKNNSLLSLTKSTLCPRSCDPFYIVSYYIKWVTTSWAYSIILSKLHEKDFEMPL